MCAVFIQREKYSSPFLDVSRNAEGNVEVSFKEPVSTYLDMFCMLNYVDIISELGGRTIVFHAKEKTSEAVTARSRYIIEHYYPFNMYVTIMHPNCQYPILDYKIIVPTYETLWSKITWQPSDWIHRRTLIVKKYAGEAPTQLVEELRTYCIHNDIDFKNEHI